MDVIEKEFTKRELEMMKNIVYHATSGLGLGSWTWDENAKKRQLKTNPYVIIRDRFLSYLVQNKISAPKDKWIDFINIYNESRKVIDETEMQTLTGYEWQETETLEKKMIDALEGK